MYPDWYRDSGHHSILRN